MKGVVTECGLEHGEIERPETPGSLAAASRCLDPSVSTCTHKELRTRCERVDKPLSYPSGNQGTYVVISKFLV